MIPRCFLLVKIRFVPSEASVQMKSKVFNIFCLRRRLVDINKRDRFLGGL
jgi:hypothetical protein